MLTKIVNEYSYFDQEIPQSQLQTNPRHPEEGGVDRGRGTGIRGRKRGGGSWDRGAGSLERLRREIVLLYKIQRKWPITIGFEPHRRHCVVVLEQDTFILAYYWLNQWRIQDH